MFNGVLGLIGSVIWFQGHTVIAHSVRTVSTEHGVSLARYLSIPFPPVRVYGIFDDSLPYSLGSRRRCSKIHGLWQAFRSRSFWNDVLSLLVCYEKEICVSLESKLEISLVYLSRMVTGLT